ncbi:MULTISPECIES: hypothetical protein [Bacillus]|uniref:hypothetical protein n=1 Tax=Bacillus TaxID=1386 RepID=UPI000BA3AFD7|nr:MULTISPECIES: hypothetical protein [Bacillus]MBY0034173.1 hypothetical protein [Bacillus velezensis]MBY0042137.1 hypothetical protein [Bacillus velezensis]MCY1637613.1 hypothetical protein [Bacillus sp. SL112]PAB04933.1 hypothetical protein BHU79_07480 [Bacillus velezensis]
MKKKIYLILSLSAALALFLTALPALSPVIFTSASEKGNWFNWKDETGQTPHVCYSKKSSEGEYKVSCGTGP